METFMSTVFRAPFPGRAVGNVYVDFPDPTIDIVIESIPILRPILEMTGRVSTVRHRDE